MARRRVTRTAASYVRRNSLRKGLIGDDPLWRFAFFVVFGRRLLKRVGGRVPEVIARDVLRPGQLMSIEAIDPETLPPAERKRYGR